MSNLKQCPIEKAFDHVGKKWGINIIRDLFLGKKRFRDFLAANPELSTKMLSSRLRELERKGIIEKRIAQKSPLLIEYHLTDKGRKLRPVLYSLAVYAVQECPKEIIASNASAADAMREIKAGLG